jgi:translation elongation factor EF-Tu-like GTPase
MHNTHHPHRQRTAAAAVLSAVLSAALAAACSKSEPQVAQLAEPVLFKAQAPVPVIFNLQKEEGQTGRSTPISTHYRPQVRFPLGPTETSCSVQLPASAPTLEPGQSASASLMCDADVRVQKSQPEFLATEGGKPVAHGLVQLP